MSSAQVPLWVAFTLGVVAICGPIGGAWIGGMVAARREDRRWEREVHREDLRWQRDRERELHQRTDDFSRHWSEKRLTAYTELLAAFETAREEMAELLFINGKVDSDDRARPLKANNILMSIVNEPIAKVELLGSSRLVDIALATRLGITRVLTEASKNSNDHDIAEFYFATKKKVDLLRAAMRVDIGVAEGDLMSVNLEEMSASNLTPSSGTTF